MIAVVITSTIIFLIGAFSVWWRSQTNRLILKLIAEKMELWDGKLLRLEKPRGGDTGPFKDKAFEIQSKMISSNIGFQPGEKKVIFRIVHFQTSGGLVSRVWLRVEVKGRELVAAAWLDEVSQASYYSHNNKAILAASEGVSCYHCLATFPKKSISETIDGKQTAICPKCGVDAILGDQSPYLLSGKGLEKLQDYWFGLEAGKKDQKNESDENS